MSRTGVTAPVIAVIDWRAAVKLKDNAAFLRRAGLLDRPDTPGTVVIDEAIELARTFSVQDAVRFVNVVLDGIHRAAAAGGTTDA